MNNNDMNSGYEPTAPHSATRAVGRTTSRGRLVAGGVAAAVLVGGAAFGAVTMLSNSPAAAATGGPTGQAAVLNDALTTATTPTTTASGSSGASASSTATQTRRRRAAIVRLRRLGGIDGQFTFETKAGPKTLAFERGTIQSVSGQDVVVRAKDGTSWNWTLVSDSVVRQDGTKATSSALSAGELVFVGGPVISGSHDARLIVIRNPQKSSSSPSSSAPSSSAPTSSAPSGS
jgi:hypothetical protein